MPVHNADIAGAFNEIADLLDLANDNPFRVRAYRNAARVVGDLRLDLAAHLSAGGELPKLRGIGADLAGKIREIAATGTCVLRERLKKSAPAGITDLLAVPGLGPKRVNALHHELGVHTLEQLQRAALDGRVRALPGFGQKTEERLIAAVGSRLNKQRRYRLAVAAQYALPLADYLRGMKGVGEVVIAGSFRRRRDTVGDLDLLAVAQDAGAVVERFVRYAEVRKTLASGSIRASVLLACGIQADLRVVAPESFGAALHYFTGSRSHNIAIRRLAQARGLKLNEYGVFRGGRRIAGETEQSVYAAVGLPYIEPELREDSGEIEAARRGELPQLVLCADLTGDLHVHTNASDGRNTLREMAEAAQASGLAYIAITEHSRHERIAHGLDPVRLAKQIDEIDRLNPSLSGMVLLKGIEVDILEDGSLDLPDSILSKLDVVVGAVHSHFNLTRERQTARLLKALAHPCLRVLAHPTARLIDERAPCDVDMLAVVRKARQCGVALELNAQPERLDLTDVHCRMTRDEGALVCINSDAHAVNGFDALHHGIGQARRGWLEARDVLNTRPLAEIRQWLAPRRT